ncbi:MAG TPA: hypothetical protein VGD95_02330 [Micavibrio sp.]
MGKIMKNLIFLGFVGILGARSGIDESGRQSRAEAGDGGGAMCFLRRCHVFFDVYFDVYFNQAARCS